MSAMTCPGCGRPISPDNVNVAEGVAYCRECHRVTHLRELVGPPGADVPAIDPASPPPGCGFHSDGVQAVIRASARSVGGAALALFIAAFWNGVTSIFVLLALGSTIHHVRGSLPAWFPNPFGGGGSAPMPLGMTIFMWIFLLPFILIGLAMIGAVLVTLAGRVEVRVRAEEGAVFIGCGPVGWTRRFDAFGVRSIEIGQTTWKQNDQTRPLIVLKTEGRTIRFGSGLPEHRRDWLLAATRSILLPGAG